MLAAAKEELDARIGLSLIGFKAQWQRPIGIHLSKSVIKISEQQEESERDTKAPSWLHHTILSIQLLSATVPSPSGMGLVQT